MKTRHTACKWAYDLMQSQNWVIWDNETTGIGKQDEIVETAVVGSDGCQIISSFVKPTISIPESAVDIHSIDDRVVENAPTADRVLIPLLQATGRADIVIYNVEFDLRLLRQSLYPYGVHLAFPTSDRRGCRLWPSGASIHCAMEWYSAFVGDWNDQKQDFKWQKLPGASHRALGDAQAVRAIIEQMAAAYQPIEPVPQYDPINF